MTVSVSSSTSTTLAVPTTPSKTADIVTTRKLEAADKALNRILNNSDVMQSLVDQSSKYFPISDNRILSTLWAVMSSTDSNFLSEKGVERAVITEGGGTTESSALWAEMNLEKKSLISAGDFALNDYLGNAIALNLTDIQSKVEDARFKAESSTGYTNMLSYMFGGSGTVMDLFT